MDIVAFAEQFLGKLEELSAKFSPDYNAPQKRTGPMGAAVEASSRKATVRIVEVTLKDLRGGVVAKTKLSRTEPALTKLKNEASQMLGCPIDCVVLVQQGQVLSDGRVEEVAAIASSTPVYVFDSREWKPRGLLYSDTFKADLISLLEKHNAPGPDKLAMRFIETLPQWLE